MKVIYSDHFVLPEGHRFPRVKYSMLRERAALESNDTHRT